MQYSVKKSTHSKNFYWIYEYFSDGDQTKDVFGPVHIDDLAGLRDQLTAVIQAKAAADLVAQELQELEEMADNDKPEIRDCYSCHGMDGAGFCQIGGC